MKLFYVEFRSWDMPTALPSPELIVTGDDGKVSVELLEQVIIDACGDDTGNLKIHDPYGTRIVDGFVDARQHYVMPFECLLGYGKITFSGPIPCYGLPEDKDVVKHFLPTMIPQAVQNEVLIRWKSRAMRQGYPVPQPDGTFGKPNKRNERVAETELAFFMGATACYEALNGALQTGLSALPPVWLFAPMQGKSIQYAMENEL